MSHFSRRAFMGVVAGGLASMGLSKEVIGDLVPGEFPHDDDDELTVKAVDFLNDPARWVSQLKPNQWLAIEDAVELADDLVASTSLRNVRRLSIDRADLGDDRVVRLIELLRDGPLVGLSLEENKVGNAGLQAIQQAPFFNQLVELDLHWNDIDEVGIEQLTSTSAASLECLEVSANDFGVEGARHLARWRMLARLEILRVGYSEIGDEGTIALAQSPQINNLAILDLAGSGIGEAGGQALLESTHFRNGVSLHLDNLLAKLRFLNMKYRNSIPRDTRANLHERFGDQIILDYYLGEEMEANCRSIIDLCLDGLGKDENDYTNDPARDEPGVIDLEELYGDDET